MSVIVEKILELLQFQTEVTVDFLVSAFYGKLGSSQDLKRFIKYGPHQFRSDLADIYRRRRRFYGMLQYLKQEGLVKKKKEGRNSIWKITQIGIEKLKAIKKQKDNPYSRLNIFREKLKGNGLTIIAFDIPERCRKKRDWLRVSLIAMEFRFLQKSVWFGKGSVDEDFFRALRERELLECIHIFSVSKKGTIREISK